MCCIYTPIIQYDIVRMTSHNGLMTLLPYLGYIHSRPTAVIYYKKIFFCGEIQKPQVLKTFLVRFHSNIIAKYTVHYCHVI